MPKVRRSSYNLAFKLKVIAEAEAVENNSKIARDYGISESMVRHWRKDQANLFNGELKMSAKRKTMGCFSPKYPELDQTLLDWFSEQRSQGISVSGLILRLKAKELSSDPDFKASLGWYQRWKKRHSISLRTKTTLAPATPTRSGRKDHPVPSVRDCTSAAVWPFALQAVQYG
nr:tigger transposable element-derived protein 2-like [Pocillopora verrucosa]